MTMQGIILMFTGFIPAFSYGEIPSSDLVGIWRDSACQQSLYIFSDLSWKANLIQNEMTTEIEGKIVITTKGENDQGTVAVFMKKKGDNGWANIALILDSKDEVINDDTVLQYDGLVLKKENSFIGNRNFH